MRHADMRVTLKHYTDLWLSDSAAAIEALPAVETVTGADVDAQVQPVGGQATGTDDAQHMRSRFATRYDAAWH